MGRTRTSRALIGFTLIAIVLGAVAYFATPRNSKARENAANNPPAAPGAASAAGPASKPAVGDIAAAPKPSQLALLTTTTPPLINQSSGAAGPQALTPANPGPRTTTPRSTTPRPPAAISTGNALKDGQAMIESGQLVSGRKVLNDALLSGRLSPADQQAAKELIGKANETLVFSSRRFNDDPYCGVYTVKSGDRPSAIGAQCDVTWEFLGRINNVPDARRLRLGPIKVIKGPFHAVVSKSKYTLDLYLGSPGEAGSMFIRQFKVGHGRDDSTPTGSWMVTPQNKLKNPKWWGTADEPAREADDPQNPLGEFWIGLTGTGGEAEGKQGFGIHGTIEPNTIGTQASHGCVRLLNQDVERLYEMLVEGKSTVIIKD